MSSEIKSLDEIQYSSKVKIYITAIVVFFLFVMAFMNNFPVGDKLKTTIKSSMRGSGCNPDYSSLGIEWLLPKLVVNDLKVPAGCFEKTGDPLTFNYVNLNWRVINFAPIGIPFRLDTELSGKPIEIYFVQGIGERLIRIKDQKISLTSLQQFMGSFKLDGVIDMNLYLLLNKEGIKNLDLHANSKNLVIPAQSIEGFTLGKQAVNDFDLKATSDGNRIRVENLIMGDSTSPIRASFKGNIDLNQRDSALSILNLTGEVTFTEEFKNSFPVDLVFSKFTQRDGFYQVKISGTLGAPQLVTP